MAYPHNHKDDPRGWDAAHKVKTDPHYKCNGRHYGQLCPHRHSLAFCKALQVPVVQLCAGKPVMQPSGTFCVTKQRRKINGTVGKTGTAIPIVPSTRQMLPSAIQKPFNNGIFFNSLRLPSYIQKTSSAVLSGICCVPTSLATVMGTAP